MSERMTASEREALVARVREQLEHWDSSGFEHVTLAVPVGDLRAIVAEVERLTRERERVIAGALFDFAGHLTTMDEVYEVGASRDSTRMVAELQAWAKRRNLALSDADVMGWAAIDAARTTGGRDA